MSETVVATQNFFHRSRYSPLGVWSRVMLPQGHHHELVNRNGVSIRTMMMCNALCFPYHLLFLLLSRIYLFVNNSTCVPRKTEDAYSAGTPGPCSECLKKSGLFICFYYFCEFFGHLFSLLCLCIFLVWPLSMDSLTSIECH